jgi:hydroxymethylpyrimidine pyrophosphatase-like HAD family hydrolase
MATLTAPAAPATSLPEAVKKWRVLATDFDGTIATHGVVAPETEAALRRAREAGLLVLLVTGRETRDFGGLNVDLGMFDLVVGENGALIYDPKTGATTLLAPPPPPALVAELERRGVTPLWVGQSIISTHEPHEVAVMESIKELGLELIITFNKGSVMVLPPNVNKASGLAAALERLQIPASAVIGMGDAENDHAFLAHCGLGVAVGNALPSLKERAHLVTKGIAGAGAVELIDCLLNGRLEPALPTPPNL